MHSKTTRRNSKKELTTNSNDMKEKSIKSTMFPPDLHRGQLLKNVGKTGERYFGSMDYVIVNDVGRDRMLVTGFNKAAQPMSMVTVSISEYESLTSLTGVLTPYETENSVKFDIRPIKERLLELPAIERILPSNLRIDEELFNLVKDGTIPSQDELRILVLRYHKALCTAEEIVTLYDSVIFGDEKEKMTANTPNIPDGQIGVHEDKFSWSLGGTTTFAEDPLPYFIDPTITLKRPTGATIKSSADTPPTGFWTYEGTDKFQKVEENTEEEHDEDSEFMEGDSPF